MVIEYVRYHTMVIEYVRYHTMVIGLNLTSPRSTPAKI
jgi:hypothetical protein